MATNKPSLLSGRVPVTDYGNLSANRNQFLSLDQAEPNLGAGTANNVLTLGAGNVRVWANALNIVSVSASGNVTGNYILGNGSQLTGIDATSIQNGTSNVRVVSSGGNVTVGVGGTGNVVIFASTGQYVTGVLSASGNVTGGNLVTSGVVQTSNFSITGNVIGNLLPSTNATYSLGGPGQLWKNLYLSGNTLTLGDQSLSSNATAIFTANNLSANNIASTNTVSAGTTVSAGGNITGANVLTGGLISATGNIIGGNLNATGLSLSGNVVSALNLSSSLTAATTVVAVGNITGGNVITAGSMSAASMSASGTVVATGNITGGNLITGAAVSAASVSASGNITGGNIIGTVIVASFSTTGNITGGNLITSAAVSANSVSASGNVTGGNIIGSTAVVVPTVRNTGTLTISTSSGNLALEPTGNIVVNSKYINGVLDPVQNQDVATKFYVDTLASSGIAYHQPVAVATTTTLATTTGGTISYTQPNGAGNGVGALLTTTGSFNLIDTANVQTVGTRILVKDEANAVYNGVYTWANATNIVRSTDADEYGPDSTIALSINDYFYTTGGNVNLGTAFVVSAPAGTITFGTSNITFSTFATSQVYSANTSAGISLAGTVINAKVDGTTTAFDGLGNISVKANAQLTTPNIGTATGTSLSVTGNVTAGNLNAGGLSLSGNVVSAINSAANITTTANISGGNIIGNGRPLTGILGNSVDMGTNTSGALVSNAVTLTTTTTVTNGIALLNQVLGKLVPASPPNFPNATTITLSGIATYRMANITQTDNTPGANKAVAAGTSVANVLRVATYATNTIANVGPGDSGTITAVRNGSNVGNVTLNTGASPTANGTYGGNLVITNNFDYRNANANIAAGFWYVFSAAVSGTAAPAGWNELYIADSVTSNTNTTVWYYDNSSPSAPSFSSTTMTPPGSANLLYSSTIPHYTNVNNFTIGFTVANISGNTYPTANTLASGSAGGAFAAPATINYSGSNIGSNVLNSFASATANTTASVTTGFGGSSTGPSMTVNNSYSSGTLTLTTALGNTVLYKSGTATAIDESNVVINTTIGTGSGNAFRIINPGTGNTPTFTGSEAAFNSQSSTLQTYDATVVGSGSSGLLKHDQTNYSTGYLPSGPNLSAGRSGTQYFTIKFVRTAVSKFDIKYTGNIAGMWVSLPGSVIDSSSSANGWIDMSVAYGGAGYPGVNSPGNGSNGCALGGTVTLNTSVTNSSKTCTFGTVSSSSTATNEIYVRLALTSGQSVTALTLETASN